MNQSAVHEKKPVQDNFLPYGHQWISEEDVQSVAEVLRSDWITQGAKINEFESAIAHFVHAKFAVAFSSGTAALHGACFAIGLGKGDEVITSPLTFVASSNCILYLNGRPVFADIKSGTYNIDPQQIEKVITNRTRAILSVDFAGHPADFNEISQIAAKYHLKVIEDASHAFGAEYRRRKIGSLSDLTVFSFHPVKSITTGEGGIVTTDQQEFYNRLLLFRTHGIEKNLKSRDPWYYEMQQLGYNYRITDFQCALGLSQLRKIKVFIKRRRQIAAQYQAAFTPIDEVIVPHEVPNVKSAWHIYVIRLKLRYLTVSRKEIFEALRKENIGVQVHYIPVYYHPYYQALGYKQGLCPKAEKYYEEVITLPIFPKMNDANVQSVISSVSKVIRTYRKKRN